MSLQRLDEKIQALNMARTISEVFALYTRQWRELEDHINLLETYYREQHFVAASCCGRDGDIDDATASVVSEVGLSAVNELRRQLTRMKEERDDVHQKFLHEGFDD